MAAVSFAGICVLVPLLVSLGLIVAGIVLLARASPGPGADGSTCGKCGYSARGLTTFTCPECGSDLREVGIQRSGRRGRAPGVVLLVIGLVLMLLLCLMSGLMWFRVSTPHRVMPVAPTPTPLAPTPPPPPSSPPSP